MREVCSKLSRAGVCIERAILEKAKERIMNLLGQKSKVVLVSVPHSIVFAKHL